LREAGIGTLLFDLLTEEEESADRTSGFLRFDVEFLARRLVDATLWAERQPAGAHGASIGYFGASTGAAAALIAAAHLGDRVHAVVSRGGRADLAGPALARVTAPTLLVVGSLDTPVIDLNESAYEQLACEKQMTLVPGAGHLFEEGRSLSAVAELAAGWFRHHLLGAPGERSPAVRRASRPS
jgi:pimeloyl-ACP methyl ester carboxylesterase